MCNQNAGPPQGKLGGFGYGQTPGLGNIKVGGPPQGYGRQMANPYGSTQNSALTAMQGRIGGNRIQGLPQAGPQPYRAGNTPTPWGQPSNQGVQQQLQPIGGYQQGTQSPQASGFNPRYRPPGSPVQQQQQAPQVAWGGFQPQGRAR